MSKRSIWAIIILMSASLIGITIIQFYRIKSTIDLNEKNFDDRITMALNNVKEKLEEVTEIPDSYDMISNRLKDKNSTNLDILGSGKKNWNLQQKEYKFNDVLKFLYRKKLLEEIDKNTLDTYLKQNLEDQGVSLKYEYGVYSTETKSFTILNGNYVAAIGESSEASTTEGSMPLYESEYQVSLFNTEEETPGYLKLFFPRKQSYLWSTVRALLLSTILFTSLILLCFSYTIFVILRQKKISEMKTDFINNMTHEFKTPIATISLAADSIINPTIINKEDKVKRFVNIIKEENKRMLNQVEKVLQMAQIDMKDFDLKLSDIHMNDVISKAVDYSRLQVEKRGGQITMNLQASNDMIVGDETHLTNIIHNLLDNATKYSKETPEVIIETRNSGKGLEINVIDHGIGMSKESIKHIFDKFYRVHTGNIHNVKGFGLGLSYVKAITDAHKGQISVKSELERGSNFTLFFPQKQEQ